MIDFKKIVKFLLANVVGFIMTPLIFIAALKFNFLSQDAVNQDPQYTQYIIGGGMWLWVVGCLLSIGYFYFEGKKICRWLILAPLYLPFLYNTATILYLTVKA